MQPHVLTQLYPNSTPPTHSHKHTHAQTATVIQHHEPEEIEITYPQNYFLIQLY